MDALIKEFKAAYAGQHGNELARTLTPDVQLNAARLMAVWESGDAQSIKDDLRFLFVRDKSARLKMSPDEAEGWQEIYYSYWKALGEILAVEGLRKTRVKVCVPRLHLPLSSDGAVIDQEMTCPLFTLVAPL